ncbi:MAG TPA: hypothetical protein VGD88_06105 [Opitutaceae bacterium]
MSKKPRSDSKLDSLLPEQREQLIAWLVDENLPYDQAVVRLRKEFGVETSIAALSRFYSTRCFTLRSSQAKEFAEHVVAEALKGEDKLDEATLALIKQKAFEHAYARNGNVNELATLAKIIGDTRKLQLKERDQDLAERRIQILEKKAAQADAAEGVTRDEQLTPEQRQAKLKEIFGLK